ncbi:LytTR family transcriptional regulator DNA-binding domain-containing protein [Salicibibacter cibarius]|uniref:LytTR family transcriptional regulator DNA-binding domain-containing protein n=1 Tax=Salicibibacter cibarius TaxID=2743000 RepID=A0A7T6Z4P8_9BACI|nr:LytTR family DNA-binding domain-containing protein [Salicibibacter cibarius]QQK76950.1 LytTR family transcriptional regulator DNA-binding domain-containing protein [Salicibibacter cibarius]
MNVKIDLNDNHEETTVIIQAKEWSPELEALVKQLNNAKRGRIVGVHEDQSVVLNPHDIDFVYAEKRKVFAATTAKQHIELKMKLYEVEELLEAHDFTRFSKSVIGNIHHIQRFELAFNGNLFIHFDSGNKEYVSRKYVTPLKEKLVMGGGSNAT